MKVLLQRLDNGFYVAGPGQWTKNYESARDFESGPAALSYALSAAPKLPPMQVVLRCRDDERFDVRLRCYNEIEPGSPLLQRTEKEANRLTQERLPDGSPPKISSDTHADDVHGKKSRAA
jgi:hypothetical protein